MWLWEEPSCRISQSRFQCHQTQVEAPKWWYPFCLHTAGSLLSSIVSSDAQVNSYHHQAIAKVGTGLRVSAEAPDGVVEAVEHIGKFVLGVQWHPELMEERCPAARALRHFVQAVWLAISTTGIPAFGEHENHVHEEASC